MGKCSRYFCAGLMFVFAFQYLSGHAQGPVIWEFELVRGRGNGATLFMTATLAPGWHLYSQFLEEGGPMPTRFRFEPGDDFVLAGVTREEGTGAKFYDNIYEMEITWYSKVVQFEQDVKFVVPVREIAGSVEYMVCNDKMCIPMEREFVVGVGGH